MRLAGVEAVDCVGVDNVLVRLGDPLFTGFCTERRAQFGAQQGWHQKENFLLAV